MNQARFYMVKHAASVREGAALASQAFEEAYGLRPDYVLVRQVPKGARDLMEMGNQILVQADWVPEQAVVVGGVVEEGRS